MQHDLRSICPLDHCVGLGEPALEIAALVRAGIEHLVGGDGLVGVEPRLELLPVDLDQLDGGPRLAERVGADRRDGGTLVVALGGDPRAVVRPDRAAHSRRGECRRQVDPRRPGFRERAAQNRGMQRPGKLQVGRIERLAACPAEAVGACRRAPDHLARARGPLLERVLLDDEPDLLEPPLDLLLGADQSRHVRIASSILG